VTGTAFVFGGGGVLGACEAGMLRALLDAGITPDLVVGTSIGAINGAAIADDPTPDAARRLCVVWDDVARAGVFGGSLIARLRTLARTRTEVQSSEPLRRMLATTLRAQRIEDLRVRFECVAASIERAAEHWFTAGPLIPAILASAAVPGVLPPVEIDGEHYVDGGIVNSIPVGRAVALGARRVFVLHVGRIERPLEPPRTPWEVGLIAFEIARRHRFHTDIARLPDDVELHVLPTGVEQQPRFSDLSNLRYADVNRIGDRVARAYDATAAYLSERALA
jgi:NTE family protein